MFFHCSLGDKIISNNDDLKCRKGDLKKKNVPLEKKKGSHKPVNIMVSSISRKHVVSYYDNLAEQYT
jgi:hypothetical protein